MAIIPQNRVVEQAVAQNIKNYLIRFNPDLAELVAFHIDILIQQIDVVDDDLAIVDLEWCLRNDEDEIAYGPHSACVDLFLESEYWIGFFNDETPGNIDPSSGGAEE